MGRCEDETVTVEIVGAGTVGEAVGIVLEEWGNEVVFKDIDEKVRKLLRNRGYRARKPSAEVGATLSLVCVPTPFDEAVGLSTDYVKSAIRTLAEQDPEVVAVRSTVPLARHGSWLKRMVSKTTRCSRSSCSKTRHRKTSSAAR
jgi:UDP-glucose 6-dehydrogenase